MTKLEGGCFCGELRFNAGDAPLVVAQCYCTDCQIHAGGHPSISVSVLRENFRYCKGEPKIFVHPNSKTGVARHFCGDCGTHILTASPFYEDICSVKLGTLDDASFVGKTQMLLYTKDKKEFHYLPEDAVRFEELPSN